MTVRKWAALRRNAVVKSMAMEGLGYERRDADPISEAPRATLRIIA